MTLRWSGGERSFPASSSVRIGRARDCDVVLDSDVVSRHHGVLRSGPRGWEYADGGSTRGSWVDGRRVESLLIEGPTQLRLGEGDRAVVLQVVPTDHEGTVLRSGGDRDDRTSSGADAGGHGPAQPGPRPGGPLRADGPAPETVLAHQRLTVEAEGRTAHFYPGSVIRLGREDADVVLDEPSVSRRHATLSHESGAWVLRDQGSAHGTHVDGRRVSEHRLTGRTEVVLGASDAGARVTLIPAAGTTAGSAASGPGRRHGLLVAGALLTVVAVAAAAAFLVVRGRGADRDALARATVSILAGDAGGSGSVVDAERGLVLTNAHVVAPRATGAAVDWRALRTELPESPTSLQVSVAPGLDRPAEPRFRAEVVAADGYLDLAVIRLHQTLSGNLVTPQDLEELTEVELGDSEQVGSGTSVTVVGFPGLSPSAAGTFTRGVISGTLSDPRLGTNRAWFTVDADISPGNSGGLAADDDGRLVGVPTQTLSREDEGPRQLPLIRAADLARPLIEAARASRPYVPAYLAVWPEEAQARNLRLLEPTQVGLAECTAPPARPERGDGGVALAFDYEDFPSAPHQDLLVRLLSVPAGRQLPGTGPGSSAGGSGLAPVGSPAGVAGGDAGSSGTEAEPEVVAELHSADHYPVRAEGDGCLTATLAVDEGLARGAYRLELYGGPDYLSLAQTDFLVR